MKRVTKEQAAVKVDPEKFTWMKYKGVKAKLLTHTKRNGDTVKTRLEPNEVFGYRMVKQRSTGKELIQIVLKSDGMDLAYNLSERSFNTHILKVSKKTVLPKQFKKPVDVKAIDKKAPVEPKAAVKKTTKAPESESDRDEATAIFEYIEMDDSDIAWLKDQMRGAEYSLLGLARFCEYVYDNAGQNTTAMREDLEGFFSTVSTSGVKKGFVVDRQGNSLKENFKNNYLEINKSPIDSPAPATERAPKKAVTLKPKANISPTNDTKVGTELKDSGRSLTSFADKKVWQSILKMSETYPIFTNLYSACSAIGYELPSDMYVRIDTKGLFLPISPKFDAEVFKMVLESNSSIQAPISKYLVDINKKLSTLGINVYMEEGVSIDETSKPAKLYISSIKVSNLTDTHATGSKPVTKKSVDRTSDVEKFIRQFTNIYMGSEEVSITIDTNFSDRTMYSMTPTPKYSSVANVYYHLMDELKDEFGSAPKLISEEVEEKVHSAKIVRRTMQLNNTEFDVRMRIYKTNDQTKLTFVEFIFPT